MTRPWCCSELFLSTEAAPQSHSSIQIISKFDVLEIQYQARKQVPCNNCSHRRELRYRMSMHKAIFPAAIEHDQVHAKSHHGLLSWKSLLITRGHDSGGKFSDFCSRERNRRSGLLSGSEISIASCSGVQFTTLRSVKRPDQHVSM